MSYNMTLNLIQLYKTKIKVILTGYIILVHSLVDVKTSHYMCRIGDFEHVVCKIEYLWVI